MRFLLVLASLCVSKESVSVAREFKEQLGRDRSPNKEDRAILWALAELARHVDKSVTGEDVAAEIGSKINEILERLEITDTVLRKDFEAMQFEFQATKKTVETVMEDAKKHIMKDIDEYKKTLLESLEMLSMSSKEAQEGFLQKNVDKLTGAYRDMTTSSDTRSIIFFGIFQVILILGLVFYKKLEKQLKMFL